MIAYVCICYSRRKRKEVLTRQVLNSALRFHAMVLTNRILIILNIEASTFGKL